MKHPVTGEETNVAWCCFDGCVYDAEWRIVFGAAPDAYTHSCNEHLSDMLDDDVVNQVSALGE